MFTVKNSTISLTARQTYAATDCPDQGSLVKAPKLTVISAADNKALINVYIPPVPDNNTEIEDARTLIKALFEDLHYDGTDADAALLGVTEVRVKSIDLMPTAECNRYWAWVVYDGATLDTESSEPSYRDAMIAAYEPLFA